ncbi:MAG TPA: hypothetical protein VMX17_10990 [Candidatus Glassbacteria bacterium]|nr:hypothetical protein [Candidatus Glassbacteria bacterium]
MKKQILNEKGKDPFWLIRDMPDKPLFKDCPIKPPEETINAAEELYLKFSYDPPHYISAYDEMVILEWHYYKKRGIKKELYYSKELVVKDSINLEWRTYDY